MAKTTVKRAKKPVEVNPPATQARANVPAAWQPPTLTTLSAGQEGQADFPPELDALAGSTGAVDFVWEPQKPGEILTGKIVKLNVMKLGGTALVVAAEANYTRPDELTMPVLVKCGKVLTSRLEETGSEVGDRIAMVFKEEIPATESGMSPMRMFAFKNFSKFKSNQRQP